jgi:hypothetical protein
VYCLPSMSISPAFGAILYTFVCFMVDLGCRRMHDFRRTLVINDPVEPGVDRLQRNRVATSVVRAHMYAKYV